MRGRDNSLGRLLADVQYKHYKSLAGMCVKLAEAW